MRYYNGPKSYLMDRLYDRMNEHMDWDSQSVHLAREIKLIEDEHVEEIEKRDKQIAKWVKIAGENQQSARKSCDYAESKDKQSTDGCNAMVETDIGRWKYCPHCARPLMYPEYASEDQDDGSFNWQMPRCSCCERPWVACPCTPASEGECRSIIEEE